MFPNIFRSHLIIALAISTILQITNARMIPTSNFVTVDINLEANEDSSGQQSDCQCERLSPFDYSSQKVRGVNLGGWFVLESWIAPSLFNLGNNVVDEYSFSKALGKAEAQTRLAHHWDKWIQASDFTAIAGAGLNHVRIPIGYWAVSPLPDDPYVQGQLQYLDRAIKWARDAKIYVWLDLHGAPGSQNGFDNSGRNGTIGWGQGDTIKETLDALKVLTHHYANDTDVVTSIELINEPFPAKDNQTKLTVDQVKDFYKSGYQTVRDQAPNATVVIHDAFQQAPDLNTNWNNFMVPSTGFHKVILDTHQYQIFTTQEVSLDPPTHIKSACALGINLTRTDLWTVVGEWTGAQTDCAKWLNGYGKGARYDGSFGQGSWHVGDCAGKYEGPVAALSKDDKFNLRHFIEAQLDAFERHSGWFFWTWKTESAPEWHMQDLLKEGLFPQPLDQRQYPNQCNYTA